MQHRIENPGYRDAREQQSQNENQLHSSKQSDVIRHSSLYTSKQEGFSNSENTDAAGSSSRDIISDAEFPNSIEHTFSSLRDDTHRKMMLELEVRKKLKPEKTEEESNIGVFIEEIEPQVRDAVLEFNRKGYKTRSSGFNGENSDYQAIGGFFTLDDETVKELEKINVGVAVHKGWHNYMEQIVDKSQPGSDTHPLSKEQEEEISKQIKELIRQDKIEQMKELARQNASRYDHWKGSTLIYFKPSKPDLETMKSEWAKITPLIKERVIE